MRGAGFGCAPAQVFGGFARLEQPALRRRQALVGGTLVAVQAGNRFARLLLSPIEGVTLLLSLPALQCQLIALLSEPRCFVYCMLQLRVVTDDHFFLRVLLGVERGNRVRSPQNCRLERASLVHQP